MSSMPTDPAHPADIVTSPEKAVADYLISRRLQADLVKKFPEWDAVYDSPDTNLVVAKRSLQEAKCVLNKEKARYDEKAKEISEKWQDLRGKQNELRDSFVKNNNVIKDNYKERQRLRKQIAGEEMEEERIHEEITELEETLQYYNTAEEYITKKVEEFKIYEEFLKKVIDTYPEYNSIDDVLNRYQSLVENRNALKKLQEKNVNQVEKMRRDVELLTEKNILEMQEVARHLSELRMEKYHVQIELDHWAQVIEKMRDLASRDYLEITRATNGIWLIYLNLCAIRKQKPKYEKSQLKEQLKYVVDNMLILNQVLVESKKFMKKTKVKDRKRPIPSLRELDQWSTDYEDFETIRSDKVQTSK